MLLTLFRDLIKELLQFRQFAIASVRAAFREDRCLSREAYP
jgi:hypothetical protein